MLQKQVADQMLIYLLVFVGSVLTSSSGGLRSDSPLVFGLLGALRLRHGPDLRRVTIQENGGNTETLVPLLRKRPVTGFSSGSRTIIHL